MRLEPANVVRLRKGNDNGRAFGIGNEVAVQRDCSPAVQDDTRRLAQGGKAADIEFRVVGKYGTDTGQNGATFGTENLYVFARRFAGNPKAAAV